MDFDTLLSLVGDEPIFDSHVLLAGDVDPKAIRVQLSRWVKAGKIYQLRRGLYAIAPPYQRRQPHPFLVANQLQRASYVSLQSALSFYGLIPDVVAVTTSVTAGRPKRMHTPLGPFEFRHITTALLFGYHMTALGEQNALVATPEKALLDLIYLQPGGDSKAYLEQLRLQNTEILDRDALRKQSLKFNTPKMTNAVKGILQLLSGGSEAFEDL